MSTSTNLINNYPNNVVCNMGTLMKIMKSKIVSMYNAERV